MIRNFVLHLVLKHLVKKTESYSTDKMLSYYGSIRERVYAQLMLLVIVLFSTVNYWFTVGLAQWSLFVLLGVISVGLSASVFYHVVLYLQIRNYLIFMFKPITDDLERPENYFKRLLPTSSVSLSSTSASGTEDKSEPSEVASEVFETETQSEIEGE